jgi:NAD(P)-dependent dehydrogenase (short-subunit alcohol dehydrogenase family)
LVAGIATGEPVTDMTENTLLEILDVNIVGTFRVIKVGCFLRTKTFLKPSNPARTKVA